MKTKETAELPDHLAWLADAPLFIDRVQVASFYDAVARPPGKATQQKYTLSKEVAGELGLKLGLSAEATPGAILEKLAGLFPSLKASLEAEGNAAASGKLVKEDEILIESIDTPQRQLVQLVVHFLLNYNNRVFFVRNLATDLDWTIPQIIRQSPRALVFLDFPSLDQAESAGLCPTRLIPTAVELEGCGVKPLYTELKNKKGESLPTYPEPVFNNPKGDELRNYWKWFVDNYSATQAMVTVEAITQHHKIRWIDFRVPFNDNGQTAHLHICPNGEFDTGVFAYNLIKRGFKHGIRVVGTVKSEPDINVLAIYEK